MKPQFTKDQLNENVHKLMETIYTGNGEPSLKEIIRKQGRDLEEFRNEVLSRLQSIENKSEDRESDYKHSLERAKQQELDVWKEKYESLVKKEEEKKTEIEKNKLYWTRTIIGLIASQIVQWGFLFMSGQ